MKISERQLLFLLTTLRDSTTIDIVGGIYTYDIESRRRVYNEIHNQQDTNLVDVGDLKVVSND